MKRNIAIWLSFSIIVTLVAFSLMLVVQAAPVGSGSEEVGASVPPAYTYDPIDSIYIRDSGKNDHLCEGSVEMKRISKKLYQYTFKDLTPGKQYSFHFCVNDNMNDRFARAADLIDYGFDASIRVFRYPSGYNPPSNELNLTEKNITIPPEGYTYDATVSLDLSNYDEDDPGNVYGYAEYIISVQRKYVIKNEKDWN